MDNHRRKTIFDIVGQVNDNVQDVHNKVHHIFNQYNEMLEFGMDEEDALYWAEQAVLNANGQTEAAQAHAIARAEQISTKQRSYCLQGFYYDEEADDYFDEADLTVFQRQARRQTMLAEQRWERENY